MLLSHTKLDLCPHAQGDPRFVCFNPAPANQYAYGSQEMQQLLSSINGPA